MKQEEKAKHYDIALDKIKRLLGTGSSCSREELEYIFPELKESEDERIRKWIIENIQETLDVDGFFEGQKTMAKNAITWLEKQGKKKFEQKFFINDKVVHKATGKIWTIHHYLKDTNSYYVEDNDGLLHHYRESELKLVEQKPADKVEPKFKDGDCIKPIDSCLGSQRTICEVCDGWYVTNQGTLDFEYENNWELVEQKPAWSEEDEKMIQDIINDIAIAQEQVYCKSRCEDEINWLKSLKDRVQPQPKNEWSEEDEYNTAFIIETLLGLDGDKEYLAKCKKMAKWLKSLNHQNTWKPSEEQMDALEDAIADAVSSIQKNMLNSLYQDLQKLR